MRSANPSSNSFGCFSRIGGIFYYRHFVNKDSVTCHVNNTSVDSRETSAWIYDPKNATALTRTVVECFRRGSRSGAPLKHNHLQGVHIRRYLALYLKLVRVGFAKCWSFSANPFCSWDLNQKWRGWDLNPHPMAYESTAPPLSYLANNVEF